MFIIIYYEDKPVERLRQNHKGHGFESVKA